MANYYKYSATMGDRTYFTSVITNKQGKDKRYFSNIESEIYFGDQEMTDLYQFEFGIDEKVLPVYGYNCYYASELVSGQRIVQGQFVVNYTDSMLIQSVLSSIDDSIYREITSPDYLPGGDLHHAIYDKQFDIMIGYGYYNVKDLQTYNATCQTIIGAKITGMHKVMDTTGQPILEVFTFMAKDFIEEHITETTIGDNTNKDNNNKNDNQESNESYVYNDIHNTTKAQKNEALLKENPECVHFVHNLYYQDNKIVLGVSVNGKHSSAKLSYCNSIEVLDKLSDTVTLPVFGGAVTSQLIFRQDLANTNYASLFDKARKDGKTSLSCDIEYEITVDGKKYTITDTGVTMELR